MSASEMHCLTRLVSLLGLAVWIGLRFSVKVVRLLRVQLGGKYQFPEKLKIPIFDSSDRSKTISGQQLLCSQLKTSQVQLLSRYILDGCPQGTEFASARSVLELYQRDPSILFPTRNGTELRSIRSELRRFPIREPFSLPFSSLSFLRLCDTATHGSVYRVEHLHSAASSQGKDADIMSGYSDQSVLAVSGSFYLTNVEPTQPCSAERERA
jgi:hypothetical protein